MKNASNPHVTLNKDDGLDGFYQIMIVSGEIWIYKNTTRIKIINIHNLIKLAMSQLNDNEVK